MALSYYLKSIIVDWLRMFELSDYLKFDFLVVAMLLDFQNNLKIRIDYCNLNYSSVKINKKIKNNYKKKDVKMVNYTCCWLLGDPSINACWVFWITFTVWFKFVGLFPVNLNKDGSNWFWNFCVSCDEFKLWYGLFCGCIGDGWVWTEILLDLFLNLRQKNYV